MTEPMHLANTPEIRTEFNAIAAKAVRQRRKKELRLTLINMANMTGIRFQQWQKYETAENELGLYRAVQFCAVTHTPLSDIFGFALPAGTIVQPP